MPAVAKRMPLCGVNDSYLYGLVVGTTLFFIPLRRGGCYVRCQQRCCCVEDAVMWRC